jgi:hypothetical protein
MTDLKKIPVSSPSYKVGNAEKYDLQEYKLYPVSEDIYNKFKEETDIDPEDISKLKESNPDDEIVIDMDDEFTDNESGSDLDVPGSELDDEREISGNEDEENNYYSLGGDDHNDLDEDKDEM